jgi:hypothetical protein
MAFRTMISNDRDIGADFSTLIFDVPTSRMPIITSSSHKIDPLLMCHRIKNDNYNRIDFVKADHDRHMESQVIFLVDGWLDGSNFHLSDLEI